MRHSASWMWHHWSQRRGPAPWNGASIVPHGCFITHSAVRSPSRAVLHQQHPANMHFSCVFVVCLPARLCFSGCLWSALLSGVHSTCQISIVAKRAIPTLICRNQRTMHLLLSVFVICNECPVRFYLFGSGVVGEVFPLECPGVLQRNQNKGFRCHRIFYKTSTSAHVI
jgi:hypothetical protein